MCFLGGMSWYFISQKSTFFIVTAVKTSNLTRVPFDQLSKKLLCIRGNLFWGQTILFTLPPPPQRNLELFSHTVI
jgi:hypothetical protein